MLNRTCFLLLFFFLVWELSCLAEDKPNVVIVLLDDSGYADFNPFNAITGPGLEGVQAGPRETQTLNLRSFTK